MDYTLVLLIGQIFVSVTGQITGPDRPTTDIADANVTLSASGTGMINDGYNLTCTASIFDSLIGFYTNLTLEKRTVNGFQVLDYSTGTNITVDLSPLTTIDAGMYKCSYDIRQDDINYQRIFEDSMDINITLPSPVVQVTTDPDNLGTVLITGTYFDLVCNSSINEGVDTDISVTVVWSVGSNTIANESEYSISNVELVSGYYISTVCIEELEVADTNAVFTCTVTVTPLISTFITGNNGNNIITISVQEIGDNDVTVAITFSSVPTAGDQLNVTCSAIVPERLIHWPSSFVISYDGGSQSIVAEDNPNASQSDVSRDDNIFSRIVTIDPVKTSDARRYFCNVTFDKSQFGNNSLLQVYNVPEPPVNLTAEEINSRNITLTWVEPRDNKAKYRLSYTTPSFLGSTNLSNETYYNTVMIVISDLHPGEYYTFTVGVINNVGISEESVPLTIRTAEEEPSGFPQNLTATTINSTAITVSWEEVLVIETNGIITHYNIIGMPDATFSVPTVEEIVDNSTFSIQFNHLEEFVIYRFTISARTVIGFGPRSPEESAQTDEAASSAVVNMSAVAITATRILVQWEAPRYPNGPISYFSVCINVSVCFNALPNDTSYTLINLTSLSTNDITVQPFTVFEGNTLVGMISIVRSVLINTTSPVTGPPSVDQRTTGTITVTLPSYTSFGKDLIFYGVIVTDRSECEDVSDFGTAYPNPQPRGDSNNDDYYIAAGWSDTSLIPDQFTAGDGDSTIATLLGQVVTFTNPRLDNFKRYCVVAIVHHDSGVINQPISRYVNLGSAVTRFGYIREIVGFVMTLLILLLIIGIVAVILIFLYRRYKTKFYSVNHKDRHSRPTESIDDANGTSLDIMTNPVEDDETTLINSSSSKQPIQVEDFPAHVSNMHSNDDYLFLVEFPTVEPQHAPTTDTAHHPDNAKKNRYVNIRAYDHSRVTLQEIPNVSGSDYINANFIDGYKAPNAYIAAQGPTPGTVADFWRMVWEQETATIVMLTNLKEKGKVKCNMYWPPHNNRVQEYGVIRVQLQEELHLSDHTIRTFSLQKEKGDERIVKQFHFTAWPDLGVPEHPASLLRFIRKVETGDPVNAGPIIVHCSAGVGRTGTFITISTQIKRLKDVETVDIFNFVQSMRYCRCLMVQTEAQYIFTHDAMLEVIECGETEVAATDLKERFCKLSAFNDTAEGLMNIEIEYERIQYTIHTEPVRYAGTLQCNLQKNRFHDVIPFDKTRCKLKAVHGVGGSDYVNANFIEGYHKDRAFVATQGPLPETTEDFWRMVWECKSSTIVMLAKVKEGPKVMCHRYWPEVTTGLEIHGPFEISLHSVRECPDYVLRELKIVDTRDLEGSSQHLKQYHYTGWPTEGVPTSAIGLLDIREQMEKWQSISGHEPIIVHCSGGCGRTGSFIAMCLLIDRLKTEGVVDIFQTVRGLRLQRPGMVCSVEQYDFVHKGILEYLGSFDNYANFSL